jgi:hypothetical protein
MPLALVIALNLIGLIPEIPTLYDSVKTIVGLFEQNGHLSAPDAATAHEALAAIEARLEADLKTKGAAAS